MNYGKNAASAARSVGGMLAAWLVLLALGGCDEKPQQAAAAAPPPAVTVATATSADVARTYEFLGRVVAVDSVDLRARVEGFLEQRLFTEGQQVKAGDLLFTIEKDQFQAQLDEAKANVAAAQATLENARLQYQRAVALVKNQNIPQATVDQRKAEQDTAEASLLQTQAAQRLAEINLGYTDIYASVAGKIGRASVSVGNLVQPSTGVLATIVSQDPIYVTFPVSQRLVLEFRRRQAEQGAASGPDAVAVHLTLADGSQYPQTGKIDFIDNQVDQATDSVTVRAVFPNPQGLLVAGQVATVGAAADQGTKSIVVPQAALQLDQAGSFVMVVGEGDKVEARRVKTGATQGVNTEILEGLKDGDKVIVEGLLKVRPGMVVQVTEAPKAAGA